MKDNIISDEEFELQMKGFTIEDINNAINIQEQKDIAEFLSDIERIISHGDIDNIREKWEARKTEGER